MLTVPIGRTLRSIAINEPQLSRYNPTHMIIVANKIFRFFIPYFENDKCNIPENDGTVLCRQYMKTCIISWASAEFNYKYIKITNSIAYVRSNGRLAGRIYGFSMYCMHYFVWCVFWYICDVIYWFGEIGCMSIPRCHWMVIVSNKLDFCMMLPVGVFLCMPGQYRVFPPLAAIIAVL